MSLALLSVSGSTTAFFLPKSLGQYIVVYNLRLSLLWLDILLAFKVGLDTYIVYAVIQTSWSFTSQAI